MKRSHSSIKSPEDFQKKIKINQESDGEIVIKIKNPYKISSKELLDKISSEPASEILSCEDKNAMLEKLHSAEILCENCENPLSLKTKLDLEKRLADPEDAEFKETILSRLEKIEEILLNLVENRSSMVEKPVKAQLESQPEEHFHTEEFYIDEEHLEEDEIPEKLESDKSQIKATLKEIDKFFPIKSEVEMNDLNEKLLEDENLLENVLSYMKFLNFKITDKIQETSKIIQRLVTDEILSNYTWDGEKKAKKALQDMTFFGKVVYGKKRS